MKPVCVSMPFILIAVKRHFHETWTKNLEKGFLNDRKMFPLHASDFFRK